MLKALKIVAVSFTGLIFILGIVLYILEIKNRDAIHQKTIEIINQNFDEQVTFKDFSVSLLNRFPKLGLVLKDVEIKDRTVTVLKIGEIKFLINVWELRNNKIIIEKIVINNANFDFQVDSLGNKPHLLHGFKLKKEAKNQQFLIDLGKIQVNNSKLIFGNFFKHNHTYINVNKGLFQPSITETDIKISAEVEGTIDSLVGNNKTLIREKSIKLNNAILVFNKNTKELHTERGEINTNSLKFTPNISVKPVEGGSIIDMQITSEGAINEFLEFMNFQLDSKFTQDNPNASMKINFKQNGLITPFLKPHIDIGFEISNALVKEENLPYPVEIGLLSGSYTNGDKHSPETTLIKIDTLWAKIEDSYINGKITVTNLKDPHINTNLSANIELNQLVKESNKMKLDGNLVVSAKYSGKVSELKKMHYSGYLAHVDLKNISLKLKSQNYSLNIPAASATLKNHFLEIPEFKGTIDGSKFTVSANVQNPLLHLIDKSNNLRAVLNINLDKIDLKSKSDEGDTKKMSSMAESIRSVIMSNITTEISVKCKTLSTKNIILKNIDLSAKQNTDNISFKVASVEYSEGKVSGKGNFKFGKNGISDVNADLEAQLKNLDSFLTKNHNNETKKNNTIKFPPSTHVKLQLQIENTKLGPFNLSKLNLASTLTNNNIDIQKLNMNIEKGKIVVKGNVTIDTAGFSGGNLEIGMDLVKVDMNKIMSDLTKNNNASSASNNKLALLEKLKAKVNFAAKEFLYSDLLLTNLNTSFTLSNNQLNVERLTGNMPFGAADISLTVNDFLSKDRKITSRVNLSLDSLNVDDILAMKLLKNDKQTDQSAKNKFSPLGYAFTKNIDVKMNITAKQIQYKKAKINNLAFIMNMNDKILEIKNFDFLFASGASHLNGYILNKGTKSYPCFVNAEIRNLNIQQILSSFDNFNQSVITPENTSGLFSWKSTHYLSFDQDLKINIKDNLWNFVFLVHDAELKEVEPLQNALFFIGHKSKSNMIIKDLNVRVSMYKDKLYFNEIIMNDNIANLEIIGSYSLADSLIDLSSKVSFNDLFFRSKKERILETRQGNIPLQQDSKVFLGIQGHLVKHKISLLSKRKMERFETGLKREIDKANKAFQQKETERRTARL